MRRTVSIATMALALLLAACGGRALEVKLPATPAPAAEASVTPAPSPAATPRAAATPAGTPSRSGTPVTLVDIVPFSKSYILATWNYLSGAGTARALYDLFTVDCQRTVSLASLERTPSLLPMAYKSLQGKNVEDVEFAVNVNLRATSAGALEVRLPLSSQIRFRIEGSWLTEYELLRQLNPVAAVDNAATLSVAPFGDSFRIASCEHLKQWDQR